MDEFFESAKDVFLAPIGGALLSLSFSWPNCSTEYGSGLGTSVDCTNVWGGVPWTPAEGQAAAMAFFVAFVFWVIAAGIREATRTRTEQQ